MESVRHLSWSTRLSRHAGLEHAGVTLSDVFELEELIQSTSSSYNIISQRVYFLLLIEWILLAVLPVVFPSLDCR